MASAASLGGGQVFAAKPVPDINNMDVAQAMALLGFNCSVSFYNTPMSDINDAFKSKIRDIHIKAKKKPNSNLKFKETTKIKVRFFLLFLDPWNIRNNKTISDPETE